MGVVLAGAPQALPSNRRTSRCKMMQRPDAAHSHSSMHTHVPAHHTPAAHLAAAPPLPPRPLPPLPRRLAARRRPAAAPPLWRQRHTPQTPAAAHAAPKPAPPAPPRRSPVPRRRQPPRRRVRTTGGNRCRRACPPLAPARQLPRPACPRWPRPLQPPPQPSPRPACPAVVGGEVGCTGSGRRGFKAIELTEVVEDAGRQRRGDDANALPVHTHRG